MNLKEKFINLIRKFSQDESLSMLFWNEIESAYSSKGRFYHHLLHLENMISELENVKTNINNWDEILFIVYYHDIIYSSVSKNNEEKSADFAIKKLKQLSISQPFIDKVYQGILATKKHEFSEDSDINYLLDADLSILGKDWEIYSEYIKNIRKEYAIYPDFLYNPGRKKVLKHFLEFKNIFKTQYFQEKYENQARENILKEMNLL